MSNKKQNIKKSFLYGADDIYLTNKYIAVRRVSSSRSNGKARLSDKTYYYPKTRDNLRVAGSIYGNIRKGR